VAAAHTICLNQLAVRARTRAELLTALTKRSIPDEAAEQVLRRLTAVGLVDDATFATDFASARQRDRGLSRAEISRQLHVKGVDPELAAQATAAIDDDAERATARGLVQRRLRTMPDLDTVVLTRRLVGLLARKGYSPGLCYAVVSEVIKERCEDAEAALELLDRSALGS
jgi:regulatory protein